MDRFIILLKKAIKVYQRGGIHAVVQKIDSATEKKDIIKFYNFIVDNTKIPFCIEDYKKYSFKNEIIINWIIPEMGIGSGGHINIFRFVVNLQNMGFKNRIYIHRGTELDTNEKLSVFIKKYYGIDGTEIELYCNVENVSFAHATIATSWQTAYFVKNFDNTISKFYFVQDFEPYFFAVGSEYLFAENTYKFGFRGITAGGWLKEKLNKEYGMTTDSFNFSYDHDIYYKQEKRDNKNRIFFYARPVTARRAFEMGLLALDCLSKKISNIEVIFAGWDISEYEIPFKHINEGSVKLDKLSDMYSQCDMCLVLSNTNLSLLPLEIMASNSVVVCSKGENSSWLVDDRNAILVDYDPISIAETLEYYLLHKDQLSKIREYGLKFAESTSWIKEVQKVKSIILKGIEEDEKNIDIRG